jgi:hypothetical protein
MFPLQGEPPVMGPEAPASAPTTAASHTRTLTVGETFQRRRLGEVGVPSIRLSGKWLSNAGFCVGNTILVEVLKDRTLLITARKTDTCS